MGRQGEEECRKGGLAYIEHTCLAYGWLAGPYVQGLFDLPCAAAAIESITKALSIDVVDLARQLPIV